MILFKRDRLPITLFLLSKMLFILTFATVLLFIDLSFFSSNMHVNLSVSIEKNIESKFYLNLKYSTNWMAFFSSFQVPVNESARQVCR